MLRNVSFRAGTASVWRWSATPAPQDHRHLIAAALLRTAARRDPGQRQRHPPLLDPVAAAPLRHRAAGHFLFTGNVADNISLGDPRSPRALRTAAMRVQADRFISRLRVATNPRCASAAPDSPWGRSNSSPSPAPWPSTRRAHPRRSHLLDDTETELLIQTPSRPCSAAAPPSSSPTASPPSAPPTRSSSSTMARFASAAPRRADGSRRSLPKLYRSNTGRCSKR